MRARRRMVGMAVLVVAGVIGFPWLFETEPRPVAGDLRVVSIAKPRSIPGEPPGVAQTAAPTPAGAEPAPPPVLPAEVKRALDAQRSQDLQAPPAAPASPRPAQQSAPAEAAASAVPPPSSHARPQPAGKTPVPNPFGAEDANIRYIVQVGAFSDVTSARAARLKVERLGIKTYTQAIDTPAGRRIRVRVGPYVNKADAENALAALKKAGMNGNLLTL